MSWTDRELKKHKVNKLASEIVNSPAYKEAQRKDKEQQVLLALARLTFISCEYLELKHGYKKNGLKNFIEFVKNRMTEIGNDLEYFTDVQKYYGSIGLDVMKELGMEIEKDETKTEKEEL